MIQNYRGGTLEVVTVPEPLIRSGLSLIQTAASVVNVGTERHLVNLPIRGSAALVVAGHGDVGGGAGKGRPRSSCPAPARGGWRRA